jgi:hypothetical protein
MRVYGTGVVAMILLSIAQVVLKLRASKIGTTGLSLAAARAQAMGPEDMVSRSQ